MRKIKSKHKKLIQQLCDGIIDLEQFKNKTSFEIEADQLIELLKQTKDDKLMNDFNQMFRVLLWELPKRLTAEQEKAVFRSLLLENHHYEHDRIVSVFQTHLKDKENIPVLKEVIKKIPDYITGVSRQGYIKRIMYAIAAQPSPENLDALQKLVENSNCEISKLAQQQITKLN